MMKVIIILILCGLNVKLPLNRNHLLDEVTFCIIQYNTLQHKNYNKS